MQCIAVKSAMQCISVRYVAMRSAVHCTEKCYAVHYFSVGYSAVRNVVHCGEKCAAVYFSLVQCILVW